MQEQLQSQPDSKNADKLLDSANTASEQLRVLHLAFMAVCAYVLVIVFGTTDLDLLIGKGVKLPVIDVEMPILGFYAVSPFLLVLVHFNLLLQLQLLSRKLFAFDAVAPKDEGIGGLHDRLHIFPYTYYLVGNTSPVVHFLAGMMVSITIVLLPLITLFAIQVRFLAYQDEIVTWFQRVAIWLDVIVVTILWPIILHPQDDWRGYWRELFKAYIPRRRSWIVPSIMFVATILLLVSATTLILIAFVLYLLTPPMLVLIHGWKTFAGQQRRRAIILFLMAILLIFFSLILRYYTESDLHSISIGMFAFSLVLLQLVFFWNPTAARGSLILLLTLWFGLLLPLGFMVDGEKLESFVVRTQKTDAITSAFSDLFIDKARRLILDEQVLFAKPVCQTDIA
jgi:hypothetical protein